MTTSSDPSALEPDPATIVERLAAPTGTFRGHLDLTASVREDGATYLSHQSFRAPYHLSKPYDAGGALHVQIVNSTAGMLAGDELDLTVRVARGASLILTTPSASRAFMMRSGAATCQQHFSVADEGWLEYSPEPLFCHRDCVFRQHTTIDLADSAGLYFVETLAPGRAGRGERWAWKHLTLAWRLRIAGIPVLQERLEASGEELERMAGFYQTPDAWFATVVLAAPHLRADDPIWERIRALLHAETWCGLTQLADTAWVVRIVAAGGLALKRTIAELRTMCAAALPKLRCDLRRN